jgi:hypothetical protein
MCMLIMLYLTVSSICGCYLMGVLTCVLRGVVSPSCVLESWMVCPYAALLKRGVHWCVFYVESHVV